MPSVILTRQIAELASRVAIRVAQEHAQANSQSSASISVTVCTAKMQSTFAFDETKSQLHIIRSNQRANLANITNIPTKTICEYDESKSYTMAYRLALAALKLIMPTNRNPAVFNDFISVKTIEVAFMYCTLPDISNTPGPDVVISDPFPEEQFRKSVETAAQCMKEVGAGGVPLIFQGTLVGSIGCSGTADADVDHECAVRGAQAAALLLSENPAGILSSTNYDTVVDDIFANILNVDEQIKRDGAWSALLQYEKENWRYGS